MESEPVVVLRGSMDRLRESQRVLEASGIAAQLVRPPESDPDSGG